jgi:hypothetical protein
VTSDLVLFAIIALSEAAAVACAVSLWRNDQRLTRRLGWLLILPIPILGPLFFAGLRRTSGDRDDFPPPPPLDLKRL